VLTRELLGVRQTVAPSRTPHRPADSDHGDLGKKAPHGAAALGDYSRGTRRNSQIGLDSLSLEGREGE
jgi:hypothetical protein